VKIKKQTFSNAQPRGKLTLGYDFERKDKSQALFARFSYLLGGSLRQNRKIIKAHSILPVTNNTVVVSEDSTQVLVLLMISVGSNI
jgi:hypothetical protein